MKWFNKLFVLVLLLAVACQDTPTRQPLPLVRPTRTPTATPSITPTPQPAATSTPGTPMPPHDHDVTTWHEPDGHHHGFDPSTSELYDFYMNATGQEIGYPWLSSPLENTFPFPHGNHEGFKFLAEQDLGCIQTERPTDKEYLCINSYLFMIHSMGTTHHLYTRTHSQYAVFEICSQDLSQCGLVATGGHADYGVLVSPYKEFVCQQGIDPPGFPYETDQGKNHIPYRVALSNTENLPNALGNGQFWNIMGQGKLSLYPHRPNNILGASWSNNDGWDYPAAGMACTDPTKIVAPCPDGSCELNGTSFQVFALRLQNLPTVRPFVGWTNVNGHVDPTCQETSPVCVPLIIEAGVPQGDALLSRGVKQGRCDQIVCQEFDDGSPLYAPGYEEH
jgi:hypothetical protein